MPTKHADLFAALAAPFDPSEVKARTQSGRQLFYVTARTVANRLDDVLGPENWFDSYTPHENSVLCALTIRLPDGSLLTKCDAGGYAGMADSGDDDKSGYSDAFKRAAVKFLVARYLYRDGVPRFAAEAARAATSPNPRPPAPPERPSNGKARHDWPGASDPAIAERSAPREPAAPKTGRALFAWVKEQEQRYEVGLLKYVNNWAKLQEFPARMVDFDAEQVRLAHAEAVRKLATVADR